MFNLVKFIYKSQKLTRLKSLLKSRCPGLYLMALRLIFSSGLKFRDFYFENKTIRFWLATCKDQRGIGRLARSLYNYLDLVERQNKNQGCHSSVTTINLYASIFFCPDRIPQNSVIIVHDIIPLKYPQCYPAETVTLWKTRYLKIICQATKIITISKSAAKDIAEISGYDIEKITVIPLGIENKWSLKNKNQIVNRFSRVISSSIKYILFVGSADKHKNLKVIISALQDTRISDIHFVLAGDSSSIEREVPEDLQKRVHFLGKVTDDELHYLYGRALALVFPSFYEGLGLPPFEAAMCRCQLILSNVPAMNEYWTDEMCYFVTPDDPEEWAKAIDNARERNEDMIQKAFSFAIKNTDKYRTPEFFRSIMKM